VYRRESISSWKSENYDACIGALYSLMGLLPSEYRPTVSTQGFEQLTNQNLLAVCKECEVKNNFASLKIHQVTLPFLSSVVSGKTTEEVWNCLECNKMNRLDSTKFIQEVLKEPYYLKILPRPPGRKEGMMGRTQFKIKFATWFWLALSSIEAQMGRYRENYIPKDSEMFDLESTIPEGGEELT